MRQWIRCSCLEHQNRKTLKLVVAMRCPLISVTRDGISPLAPPLIINCHSARRLLIGLEPVKSPRTLYSLDRATDQGDDPHVTLHCLPSLHRNCIAKCRLFFDVRSFTGAFWEYIVREGKFNICRVRPHASSWKKSKPLKNQTGFTWIKKYLH